MIDLKRKLNYDFYSLSLSERLNIIVSMGMIKNDYRSLSVFEMQRKVIKQILDDDNLSIILRYLVDLSKEVKDENR